MMVNGLQGIISGGISSTDLSAVLNCSKTDSTKILNELVANGIGNKKEGLYFFEKGDKLRSAILMLKQGYVLDDISVVLDWKDFEGLVSEILAEKNFAVIKNLILTKPRMEIDVIGVRMGIAMLIDCKHWKFYSYSALKTAVKKQIARTKHYVSTTQNSVAVPVIVTLYKDKVDFIDNVPLVPVSQFSSFVDEFYGHLDQMKIIKTDK